MQIIVKSAKYSIIPDPEQLLISEIIHPLSKNGEAIFGLIRILGKPNNTRMRLLETMEDRLRRFKETLGGEVNVPRRFEQLLQAINEDIANIMSEEKKIPLDDFHAVIGVISKNQIFTSGIGNLSTVFMHRSAKQRYEVYELEDQFKGNDEISWDKPFVSVLDGELNFGDIFYIANRVSVREITLGEIQDILVTLPPLGALKRIQQHLNPKTAYGAICFQVIERSESTGPKKINPLSSMNQLDQTQEQTELLLSAQKPNFAKWVSRIVNPLLKKLSAPGTSGVKSTLKQILKLLIRGIAALITALIYAISFIFKIFKQILVNTPSAYEKVKKLTDRLPNLRNKIKKQYQKLLGLPAKIKYAGIGILATIVLLSVTLTILGVNRSQQKQDTIFNNMVESIEEKKDAAEASLIYNNTEQAQKYLDEALALLETLPAEKKSQEEKINELAGALNSVLLEIQGIEYIEVNQLADLTVTDSSASCRVWVSVDSIIYCLSSDGKLYRLNELDQTLTNEPATKGSISEIKLAANRGSDIIFIDATNTLGVIDLANKTLNPIISGAAGLESIEDILIYNDNLYVLSATEKQIIKMREQGSGYEAGTNWISSLNSNFSDARALTIDGDVYVLMSDRIIKFSSGTEQTFKFDDLDPKLTNAVDIWTDIDSKYIYILDKGEGRVIVYDKNGRIVTQYMNEVFEDGQNLIVREDKKSIIVTTSTKIYSLSATHLLP